LLAEVIGRSAGRSVRRSRVAVAGPILRPIRDNGRTPKRLIGRAFSPLAPGRVRRCEGAGFHRSGSLGPLRAAYYSRSSPCVLRCWAKH